MSDQSRLTPLDRSFEDQCHFMARQSEMLSEEGNDISANVMLDALRMFTAEHKRAEEATLQLGYMKAGTYQQQAKGWEAITKLLDEIYPGWSTSEVEYDGKTGIQRATEAIRRLSARSESGLSVAPSAGVRTITLTTDQQQRGVSAYQQWKENVSNPASSAFGGNLHDLARRMFEAMTNADPQEISAEASSRADGEASAAKKPGATASTPCQPGEAETPCGSAPVTQSATGRRCAVDESECRPECDGDNCPKIDASDRGGVQK